MFSLNKKLKPFFFIAIILLTLLFLRWSGCFNFFSLDNLKAHRQELLAFVGAHYYLTVLIYLLFTTLVVATTLPLAAFVMILAGLLFGIKWGIFYANIGSTIGACLSFIWLRYAFGKAVPARYQAQLDNVNSKLDRYGSLYFLALHLMSILPFFIINTLAVITNLSFFAFFWTTSLGIIPISILYAYIGQSLGEITTVKQVLSWPIMLAFLCLALLAILPALITRVKKT